MSTVIHVRLDKELKDGAGQALESMGLTISDAVRILLTRINSEQRFPFEIKVPNTITIQAIGELESGGGKTYASFAELEEDLHAEN